MTRYCRECGEQVSDDARFCQACGSPLDAAGIEPPTDASAPVKAGERSDAANGAAQTEPPGNASAEAEPGDREETLWDGGYSARAMSGGWVLAVVLTLSGGGAALYFLGLSQGLFVTLVCAVVFCGGVGLYLMFLKLRVHYTLSNQRFVHQTGLLRRVTDRIEVIDIDDVAYSQGPLERLVGVGTIKIISSDRSHPELFLHGIRDVAGVARQIDDARRAERRRRGLYIEAI